MYLLIHTMTITENDCVIQAQFFHAVSNSAVQVNDFRLVGRRLSLRYHPNLRANRSKLNLQRLLAPNLKTLMKRNALHIKHQVRAIHIGNAQSQNRAAAQLQNQIEEGNLGTFSQQELSPATSNESNFPSSNPNVFPTEQLIAESNPQLTTHWLTVNRFEKYLPTFASFCGADMLRMSREDLIQICGQADGIRLYNALHSKAIAPRLTIYICRDNTSVFNAVFLSTHNNVELMQKLSVLTGIPQDQIRDIYMQGPQSIHVHLSNDVIKHIKEETMFSLEIMQDSGSYIFVLKPIIK